MPLSGTMAGRQERRAVAALVDLARVPAPLLWLSASAWLALAFRPHSLTVPALCANAALPPATPVSLELVWALNPPGRVACDWVLMVTAMMVPLLAEPVRRMRQEHPSGRRYGAVFLLVAACVGCWLAAGAVLSSLAVALRLELANPGALLAAAGLAVAWHALPARRRCLAHCRAEAPGAAAAPYRGALRFGLTYGIACIGVCWALMLVALVVPHGHLPAMLAVTLWLLAERSDWTRLPELRRVARRDERGVQA